MKDKVVVITGGSSGIGRALAEVFGKNGSRILITGRNKTDLDNTVSELASKGISIRGFVADASLMDDNKKMAQEAIGHFGRIDVLVNNAGISMRALFEDGFRGAFGENLPLAIRVFHHHRHHAPGKIERNLVCLAVFIHGEFLVQFGIF